MDDGNFVVSEFLLFIEEESDLLLRGCFTHPNILFRTEDSVGGLLRRFYIHLKHLFLTLFPAILLSCLFLFPSFCPVFIAFFYIFFNSYVFPVSVFLCFSIFFIFCAIFPCVPFCALTYFPSFSYPHSFICAFFFTLTQNMNVNTHKSSKIHEHNNIQKILYLFCRRISTEDIEPRLWSTEILHVMNAAIYSLIFKKVLVPQRLV
jgi:hypothetical protein